MLGLAHTSMEGSALSTLGSLAGDLELRRVGAVRVAQEIARALRQGQGGGRSSARDVAAARCNMDSAPAAPM